MHKEHIVTIDSIDIDGKGVSKVDGKVVFIAGSLPQEQVSIQIYKQKANFDVAHLLEVITPSPYRVTAKCPYFGICGGCSMQHLEWQQQVIEKQKVLIDNLAHIGRINNDFEVLEPLYGTPWNYRLRARLSVRYVAKKQTVLVGFREKGKPYVMNMDSCEILPDYMSGLLPKLKELLTNLTIRSSIPQIEVAIGDNLILLVLRIMEELAPSDQDKIKTFVDLYSQNLPKPLQIWLQPKGIDSCYAFYPLNLASLHYTIPKFDLIMPFHPSEFTQVNDTINNEMLALAISLLDIQAHEQIADFFCGIGNFTLPIAKLAKEVTGIEGSSQLTSRAQSNAIYNKLEHKVSFITADLFKIDSDKLSNLGKFDKWLIDPPRTGASELISAINANNAPKVIVYVSCNPATLARDTAILVNTLNYKLSSCGVMNMFPHTSHVESIALFTLA